MHMPALNSGAAFHKKYLISSYKYLAVLLECLTVLLETIDLFDTVDDITQKTLKQLHPLFSEVL